MAEKLSILYVRNPFDPSVRDLAYMDWRRGASLADYMLELAPAEEYALSLNGGQVALELRPTTYPCPGDQLVVCPVVQDGGDDGKSILRMIAVIVVTIVAAVAGQLWVGPALAGVVHATGTAAQLIIGATAAVMGIGASMLMNALLPPPNAGAMPVLGDNGSESPTYGWTGVSTMAMQGTPIPVVYGTHRVGGNVISQKIVSVGTSQYLDLLLSECEGPVESISGILINSNPSSNFAGLDIHTRLGTMDQTIIPYFGDISTENSFNMGCEQGQWVTRTTVGDGVEAVEVDLSWPSGLCQFQGENQIATSVDVDIQYKPTVYDDSYYISFDGYPATITANTREPYVISARVDGLARDQYTVRVMRRSPEGGYLNISNFSWTALREIVYDDMAYPGVALLGLRALATNQLSGGAPNITCLVTRGNISVYDGVNWHAVRSDNPAWAAYDMLTNTMYGGRIPVTRVDYPSFKRWADFCDENAPNGLGGYEKRMTFNCVIDTATSLWDAVNLACQVGRGAIIVRGTKYFAYYDAPGTATQLFSIANIVPDSFQEVYLPTKDRATELEVQYADAENNYERSSINVMTDAGFAGTAVQQKTTVSMLGCVSSKQAYREARYRLLMNQYLIRTISFDVGIDSLACEVGDLIYVQHDIPSWGQGGRVQSSTINTVTLDQPVTLVEGHSYRVMIRHGNDLLSQRNVTVPVGGYTGQTLTVTDNFPQAPSQYDMYCFGEVNNDRRVFRLVSVRRSKDLDFSLTALEYNDIVYTEQNPPVPPQPPRDWEVPPHVQSISVTTAWVYEPDEPLPEPPTGNGGTGIPDGDGNGSSGDNGTGDSGGGAGGGGMSDGGG